MMAETVIVHFIDENKWSSYDAYVYDKSTDKTISTDHGWPGNRKNYTTATTINNKKVVTWTIDLGSCSLANARIVFNNGSGGKGNQYPESGGFEVANNQYYNNIGKTDAPSAGGGSTGGGSETTYPTITVKSQYITGKWDFNSNFKFTTADGKIYTCKLDNVPSGTEAIWFRIVRDGKEYGPQSTKEDLLLTDTYQPIYENGDKALKIVPTPGKTSYTITYDYENNQIKYDAPESGGTGGGGSTGGTTVTNPLSGRVYSEGYYLVGNFFNFDGPTINYDDAVFKFKQQEDDKDGNAVYMLEIPATLTARAQVMSVDATGTPVAVYGPGSVRAINNSTLPVGADNQTATAEIQNLKSSTEIKDDGTNYWDMTTRRTKYDGVGQDGSYKYYITVDKTTGKPSKWEIKYTDLKRVAFLLSTNPLSSALTVGSLVLKIHLKVIKIKLILALVNILVVYTWIKMTNIMEFLMTFVQMRT